MSNFIKLYPLNSFLLISWIINFISIGKFLTKIKLSNLFDIDHLIDARGNLVVINIIINIFILIFLLSKEKKISLSIVPGLLFFIFCILQSISYFFFLEEFHKKNYNLFFFLSHIFFIISPILTIINLLLINNQKLFRIIILCSIIIVLLYISFITISVENIKPQMFVKIFFREFITINFNGFSRLILLIYFFLLIIFLQNKSTTKKIFFYLSITFINFVIIYTQSRTAFILSFLCSAIIIFFEKNNKTFQKLVIFISIFIIPIFLYLIYFNPKENRLYKLQGEKNNLINQDVNFNINNQNTSSNKNEKKNEIEEQFDKLSLERKIDIFSTGRLNKWFFAINEIYSNKIEILFGMGGPQSDRLLFMEKFYSYQVKENLNNQIKTAKNLEQPKNNSTTQQGQDIANGALYSLITAGVLGFLIYLFIILFFIVLIFKILLRTSASYSYYNSKDIYYKYSSIVLIFLILRSVIENGFMVWGIDNIFFLMCSGYICKYYFK